MAKPQSHGQNSAGVWNKINRELWNELGMKVPLEALLKIRQIRRLRGGRQGNTEMRREAKILIAIRDGLPWQTVDFLDIDHIVSRRNGGTETASNMRLLTPSENQAKGAF